jgi:hypothetical protein
MQQPQNILSPQEQYLYSTTRLPPWGYGVIRNIDTAVSPFTGWTPASAAIPLLRVIGYFFIELSHQGIVPLPIDYARVLGFP